MTTKEKKAEIVGKIMEHVRACEPLFRVIPVIHYQHKQTGRTHGVLGLPFNANREDYRRILAGFARMGTDGCTYGTRRATREEILAESAAKLEANLEGCRTEFMKRKLSELPALLEFWIGQRTRYHRDDKRREWDAQTARMMAAEPAFLAEIAAEAGVEGVAA